MSNLFNFKLAILQVLDLLLFSELQQVVNFIKEVYAITYAICTIITSVQYLVVKISFLYLYCKLYCYSLIL